MTTSTVDEIEKVINDAFHEPGVTPRTLAERLANLGFRNVKRRNPYLHHSHTRKLLEAYPDVKGIFLNICFHIKCGNIVAEDATLAERYKAIRVLTRLHNVQISE